MLAAVLGLALALAPAPGVALTPCKVQLVSARCGTLSVPENRARPNSRRIALRIVVVPSVRKPAEPDAFTYLAGGPGGAATDMTQWIVTRFAGIHGTRDIVLVDQRGTGGSNPLACPQPGPLKTTKATRDYVTSCLRSAGGDMTQYGTRAAMDDLEAVRRALGYRRLDLYGASYGATAAQVFVKRHPGSVRTIVLDGATAIDVPFYGRFAQNAAHAIDDVARRCAADRGCASAFPNWRTQFSRLVRDWDETPVENRPGEKTTGTGLAGVVQTMLLDAGNAAAVPLVVAGAAAGDYAPLNRFIQPPRAITQLMYWSIWCNEPWVGTAATGPWNTDFDTATNAALTQARTVCSFLPKRHEQPSAWREPRSRVPLLALAGGADPQDPISNLPRLKQTFPNSRTIVVPHYGHTVGQYGCLGDLVSGFVLAGSAAHIDTRCVRDILAPAFALS